MQKIISAVAEAFNQSETGKDMLAHYVDMNKHPGWSAHQTILIELGNRVSNEVLTRKFQSQDAEEKLIRLAAYSMISEVIKFLLNPAISLEKAAKFKRHNIKMEATHGKQPKGVINNG